MPGTTNNTTNGFGAESGKNLMNDLQENASLMGVQIPQTPKLFGKKFYQKRFFSAHLPINGFLNHFLVNLFQHYWAHSLAAFFPCREKNLGKMAIQLFCL